MYQHINLTELKDSLESIELTEENEKGFQFTRGNLLKKKIKLEGAGKMIFYLNKRNKIYLQDFRQEEQKIIS